MTTRRIILERSDANGWRVAQGPQVLFVGGRVATKRFVTDYCRAQGLRSWFNRKANGQLVEVAL